jgi:thioesterase domain-containing protein
MERTYRPVPLDIPVTLFAVEQRPWYMDWDPMEPWKQLLTGPLEVVTIPGNHLSCLSELYVQGLAERIERALREAEGAW